MGAEPPLWLQAAPLLPAFPPKGQVSSVPNCCPHLCRGRKWRAGGRRSPFYELLLTPPAGWVPPDSLGLSPGPVPSPLVLRTLSQDAPGHLSAGARPAGSGLDSRVFYVSLDALASPCRGGERTRGRYFLTPGAPCSCPHPALPESGRPAGQGRGCPILAPAGLGLLAGSLDLNVQINRSRFDRGCEGGERGPVPRSVGRSRVAGQILESRFGDLGRVCPDAFDGA